MAVVQLPGGQFQVQGVIQSAQSSVIQSPQVQTAQVSPCDFFFFFFKLTLIHSLCINHCRCFIL